MSTYFSQSHCADDGGAQEVGYGESLLSKNWWFRVAWLQNKCWLLLLFDPLVGAKLAHVTVSQCQPRVSPVSLVTITSITPQLWTSTESGAILSRVSRCCHAPGPARDHGGVTHRVTVSRPWSLALPGEYFAVSWNFIQLFSPQNAILYYIGFRRNTVCPEKRTVYF